MAVDKGWWEGERSAVECWVNFHAELSEAWEEYRCGRMATWYADSATVLRSGGVPKPEGFWVEIGDLMIRIADYVGSRRFNVASPCGLDVFYEQLEAIPRVVARMHHGLAMDYLLDVVDMCCMFAEFHKVDLWSTIREKLRYNATRPHRHGGKKA
jgi:hypothetical protein